MLRRSAKQWLVIVLLTIAIVASIIAMLCMFLPLLTTDNDWYDNKTKYNLDTIAMFSNRSSYKLLDNADISNLEMFLHAICDESTSYNTLTVDGIGRPLEYHLEKNRNTFKYLFATLHKASTTLFSVLYFIDMINPLQIMFRSQGLGSKSSPVCVCLYQLSGSPNVFGHH
jgi:hypothetical protein